MKALPGIPKVMIFYSLIVVTLIFTLGCYMEYASVRYKRHYGFSGPGLRVPRDMPVSDSFRPCETVHLAFISEDVTSTINLVKSILMHRHSSLHLHIVDQPFSKEILQNILMTWKLPNFNYTFYSLQTLKDQLSWIPDVHAKDLLGFVKLLLLTTVPKSVNRLIVIDSNVTFLDDIRDLHSYFWDMQDNYNMFASVSKLQKITVSPVIEDTGVLLFDLSAINNVNWFHLWHRIVFDGIKNAKYSFNFTSILNSIIQLYPNSHLTLPCHWNIHFQSYSSCVANTTHFKLLHWESSHPTVQEKLFRENMMEMLGSFDGKNFRRKPWICSPPKDSFKKAPKVAPSGNIANSLPKRSRREMCRILKRESEQVFRTHRYYYGNVYIPSSEFETTLVTQLSLDRLDKFLLLINHWDGPISITMYGTDAQAWNLTKFITEKGINRKNLAIHIVYRQGKFYPVNHLRNIALNSVTTSHVFLNDGDFLPSYGLFHYLKSANKVLLNDDSKRAIIVPAFDGQPGFGYPESKADLLDKLNNHSIRIFCSWCAHQTHGQTNYSLWAESSYPYKVEWAFHFEPYVVVRSDVVRYDERFVGYGWNKVSQITELKAQGYEFVVIPDGFVIHSPHKRSTDREVWKRKNFKFCINTLWKRFLQDLMQKYGTDCLHEDKKPPSIIKIPIT